MDKKKKEDINYKMNTFNQRKYNHAELVAAANQERIEKDFFVNDDNDGNDIINIPTVVNNQNDGRGQFDGAASRAEYDRDPTSYSGSFNKGGRVGYFFGGLAARGMKR